MTTPTLRTPTLRRVARAAGDLAVADYPGAEPAIVVMHGFLDRRSINEPLAEQLDRRRVLLFDFLGYGESDKPAGHSYDAASFEDDLDAVVSELTDKPIVLVGHDASGPTAINWARRNPERTEHLVLLNTYYHQTPSLRFPEIIALFADPATRPLTTELAQDQVLLLLALLWQGAAFSRPESARGSPSPSDMALGRGKAHWFAGFPLRELCAFVGFSPKRLGIGLRLLRAMMKWRFVPTAEQLRWVEQFTDRPSTSPAFLGWTGDLHQNVVSNTAQVDALRSFDRPVTVAFGRHDPYLTPALADEIAALFPTSNVQLLEAGHWPQLELPKHLTEIVSASTVIESAGATSGLGSSGPVGEGR
jgi:haloalkane dehalogenase